MGREIKFRAWDKKHKKMIDPFGLYNSEIRHKGDFYISFKEDLITMQYTGLKDNTKWKRLTEDERTKWTLDGNMPSAWNGKEIYESDIVYSEDAYQPNFIIEWAGAGWRMFDGKDGLLHDEHDEFISNVEVIGNIYENPELVD